MPSRFLRAVATFAAGLVVVLSLSAVSPQLHEWLHEQGQDHASLPCAHPYGQAANSTAPRA